MIDWHLVLSLGLGLLVGHILIVIFDALLGLARRNTVPPA
jgi:hypothetical protein